MVTSCFHTLAVVQSLSCVRLIVTSWTATCHASLSFTIFRSWLKPMSIESVMPSNNLIFYEPLFLPSIFPALGSFLMSRLFVSGDQCIVVSASAAVLPMNIHGWVPLGLICWISLQSKGLSRVFSNITIWKRQFFSTHLSLWSNSHIHMWLMEKP